MFTSYAADLLPLIRGVRGCSPMSTQNKGPWCVRSRALTLPLGLGGWVYQGPKEGSRTYIPPVLLPYTVLSVVLRVARLRAQSKALVHEGTGLPRP